MLTIVFYSTNGAAAKIRAREICAQGKLNYARVYDVAVWDGTFDKCDSVEIMDDVPDWHKKRIEAVYGEVEEVIPSKEVEERVSSAALRPLGNFPPKENTKRAVHRGGGRWFVMDGEQVISGPHDKAEAQRIAEQPDEVTGADQ